MPKKGILADPQTHIFANRGDPLLIRIVTSIIAFPAMAFIIAMGGLAAKILIMAVSIVGMFELYRAMGTQENAVNTISYFFIIVYYIFIDNLTTELMMLVFSLYILSCLMCLVFFHGRVSPIDTAVTVLGFFYVGFLLSWIYLTREHVYGEYFVWLIFISAWGCDTFAYFTGRFFGRHKLAPVLSPKKTVEGSVGGVLGSALLSFIFTMAVSRFAKLNDGTRIVLLCSIIGAFGAGFSQFGDLTASAVKRYTGIKDYGKIIPGHGGVLDRFDSVLFTAPVVYAALRLLLGRL